LHRASRRYRCVVRLKGGDPFIFGRGGEEALALARAGVPFEIIPGVSAGIAAAAYAGVPLTHRGLASQVILVTAHEDVRKKNTAVDWRQIARQPGTVVIFMGMARLPAIARRLIRHGRSRRTPVVIVQNGTLPQQRTVTAPLSDIAAAAARAGITHPAVVILGAVGSLRTELNWFESRPLFGRKFLVTRPASLAPDLVRLLSRAGAQTVVYPLIEIVPETIPPRAMATALQNCDWVVFTSRTAVELTLALVRQAGQDSRIFGGTKIAVLGTATRDALAGHGLRADCVPESFTMEGLAASLQRLSLVGKRVLLPHSRQGRPLLRQELQRQGARVRELFLYRVGRPAAATGEGLSRLLRREQFDGITFTSSSGVREFMELLASRRDLVGRQTLIAIGPITSQTMAAYGFPPAVTAQSFTAAGLVSALTDYFGAVPHD
jgi:uroporphyrinogen III methyltransferase/synthase